ncbi:MAG: glycosyltransferase [Planctomycetota bacterium]
MRRAASRLVFDLDDAIYRTPDKRSAGRQRGFAAMVCRADEVWAGNDTLRQAALDIDRKKHVEVLPTALEPSPYTPRPIGKRDPRKLVWIGSSSTRPYLEAVMPDLEAAAERVPGLSLRIVADFTLESDRLAVEASPWSSETEAEDLATAGIGLGPLTDTPWTRGKCGFKLLQYMAAGLPTICDPVGANGQIVVDGETGLHISAQQNWADAIVMLCGDADKAQAMGRAGRERLNEVYALDRVATRMVERLSDLVS